jgi:predicted amidohydrolase YtcJ
MINLSGLGSVDAIIEESREQIARLHLPAGALVIGRGFDQENFTGNKQFPTRYDLDKAATGHPFMISRVCGHVIICNTRMLEMAGISESAPRIAGGTVETDETGKPTEVLRENAAALARNLIPPQSAEELEKSLSYAMNEALAHGITAAASFDSNGPDFRQVVDAYSHIYRNGGPPLRLSLQCGIQRDYAFLDELIRMGLSTGTVLHHPYLKMGPLKLFADGTLGSRTAWMREPYRDSPETTGLAVTDPALMGELIQKAAAAGLQVAIHAIGDAAVEQVISCYEAVTGPGHNPLRHGLIHCQITDPGLLERMAKNDILALVQPIFLRHDLYIVENRVGKALASTSYAWGSMERLGIRSAYGTDCPVESIDPLQGIACAVTRKDPAADYPSEGFFSEERVDVYTAVDNYTTGSAYANFDETRMGRICPGALADLVLLDQDIFTIDPEEIHKTRVVCTMVGGEPVYGKDNIGSM